MKKILLTIMLLVTSQIFGATINVPADYTTIQEAIDAASNSDTIQVSAGTYKENITFDGKSIILNGENSDVTFLEPINTGISTIRINSFEPSGIVISNFTIQNGGANVNTIQINGTNNTIYIINNLFRNNLSLTSEDIEVISCNDANVIVKQNVFYNNGGIGCIGFRSGTNYAINNTIYNNLRGILSVSGQRTIINNTITNCNYGINSLNLTEFDFIDYNNVWNNGIDYGFDAEPGANDLSLDPLFVNELTWDFHLQPESPLREMGYPHSSYNDPDGSRNDIGAFYYDLVLPFPKSMAITGESIYRVTDHQPQFNWIFYEPLASQYSFEIEVGVDLDWSVAELWTSGEIVSSDPVVNYSGLPLVDGEKYYYRLRLNNGSGWGSWISSLFQMNSEPSTAVALSPADQEQLHYSMVNLFAQCPADPDGDYIYLHFEIYNDEALTDLWETRSKLRTADSTETGILSNLEGNKQYWWRVRTYDEHEYGNWSDTKSFMTLGPMKRIVPDQYINIQRAIDACYSGDTVYVKSGTYREDIDFEYKSIILLGENNQTTILDGLENYYHDILITTDSNHQITELSGFTIINGDYTKAPVYVNGDYVTIKDCIFKNNMILGAFDFGVIDIRGDHTLITRNIFYGNGREACIYIKQGDHTRIINNTMHNNYRGIYMYQGLVCVVMNNIIINSNIGISKLWSNPSQYILSYNNLWNNNSNYQGGVSPGASDISVDPKFLDADGLDFNLSYDSPCIDAGDPVVGYNDPDGTRNDMGALYYNTVLPVALQKGLLNEELFHVVSPTPTFFWTYFDTLSSQTAYEIEVGSDLDWNEAEIWSSGVVSTEDTTAVYDGLQLNDGNLYFYRLRVSNSQNWGSWIAGVFSMNSAPEAPLVRFPISTSKVNIKGVNLIANTSADDELDELVYDIELYSDEQLTSLVKSFVNLTPEGDSVMTGLIDSLRANIHYWWRVRAYDGYEYSQWSETAIFQTYGSQKVIVPTDFATIQEAINVSFSGDTVYIMPGIYTENLIFQGKALCLLGEDNKTTIIEAAVSSTTFIDIGYGVHQYYIPILSNLTLRNSGPVNSVIIAYPKTVIENCIIYNNIPFGSSNIEVLSCRTDSVLIKRNIFYGNGGIGCVGVRSGRGTLIINNTFDSNERGMFSISNGAALNNIVTNNSYGINSSGFDSLEYNNVWNNNTDYGYGAVPSETDIEVDPKFVNNVTYDFRLYFNSLCVDAGHPDIIYNDPDGSRGDIGALYGTVGGAPDIPLLLSPDLSTDSIAYDLRPTFVWSKAENNSFSDSVWYNLLVSIDPNFSFKLTVDSIADTTYQLNDSISFNSPYWVKIEAFDPFLLKSVSPVYHFRNWILGDLDHTFILDIDDLVFMVDYMFRGGADIAPQYIGDFTGDCLVDIEDLVVMVDYMFRAGDAPGLPCQTKK